MDKITYSQPSNPDSWSAENIQELPFKFATHDDAMLAAAHLNPILREVDRLRAINAELLEALEFITGNADQMAESNSADRGLWLACAKQARAALAKAGEK